MKQRIVKTRLMLLAGLAIAVAGAIALNVSRHKGRESSLESGIAKRTSSRDGATLPPAAAPSASDQFPSPKVLTVEAAMVSTQVAEINPVVDVKTQAVGVAKNPSKKKVVQDPLAREALSLVGLDSDAEQYWFAALTDPNLPKNERQDLVDDLNEEGLPDPKHPTLEDLPLIVARIEMIEGLAGWAADDLDWKEPYEDLVNLVEIAMGGGKPVH